MRIRTSLLIIMTSTLLTSALARRVPASDKSSEHDAIAKVIHDSICWALTKDRALLESTMAQDDELFIFWTDTGGTVAGWSQFLKLFDIWMDPRFKATLTEVHDLRIHVARSGQVAWYSAMLDDLGEWDGKPVGARDIRWTGVLEKREGKWIVVQQHGSVARDKVLAQSSQNKDAETQ